MRERAQSVPSTTHKIRTGCGNIYIICTTDGQGPCEVFAKLGQSGVCESSHIFALTVAITLGLRSGVPADLYIRKLKGITCQKSNVSVHSCIDAVAVAMEQEWKKL